MDLTDKLLDDLSGGERQDMQVVIICLHFPAGKLQKQKVRDAVFDLDEIFRDVIEMSGIGVYAGYKMQEENDGDSVIYTVYGRAANLIYRELRPILHVIPMLPGSYIIKRYAQCTKDSHNITS